MRKMVQKSDRERGQSLVELALTLTFLLLLTAGAIDLGRAFFTYITLRDAAQEGAIYGSYKPMPADVAEIKNRVMASATSPIDTSGINPNDVSISYIEVSPAKPQPYCPGNGIQVRVSYNFEITMPLLGAYIGGQSFPIDATVTDTILRTDDPDCS